MSYTYPSYDYSAYGGVYPSSSSYPSTTYSTSYDHSYSTAPNPSPASAYSAPYSTSSAYAPSSPYASAYSYDYPASTTQPSVSMPHYSTSPSGGYHTSSSSGSASPRSLSYTDPWTTRSKEHVCNFPNCSRSEGFTTLADLNRHMKSVHRVNGKYWICMEPTCPKYQKEFPRKDNLQDHLKRVHQLEKDKRDELAEKWTFTK